MQRERTCIGGGADTAIADLKQVQRSFAAGAGPAAPSGDGRTASLRARSTTATTSGRRRHERPGLAQPLPERPVGARRLQVRGGL